MTKYNLQIMRSGSNVKHTTLQPQTVTFFNKKLQIVSHEGENMLKDAPKYPRDAESNVHSRLLVP